MPQLCYHPYQEKTFFISQPWLVIPFALLKLINLAKDCVTTTIEQQSNIPRWSSVHLIPNPFHLVQNKYSQVVFGLSFRRFTSTSSPPGSDHSLSALELNRLSTMEVLRHIWRVFVSLHMFSHFSIQPLFLSNVKVAFFFYLF